MSEKLYTVCWHDSKTGEKTEGQPCDYDTAAAWAREMNKKYPHISHWVREAEKKELKKRK